MFDALEITSPTVAGQPRRARALVVRTPILAVAVVLATAAGIYSMRRAAAPAAASADALGAFWAGGSATSVAVLPFNNTSGDTANEHFSDGLTDELSSALEKVAGLRVAALASVFALKHTSLTLRAQAETLKVAALIEGGVRRDGGRIKVHARLWRAKDDSTLWSESYDRKVGDLFAVQEEIAGAIVSALHARPRGSVAPTLVRIPTRNLAAHELYLRGIHDDATRGPKGVLMAIDELRQATQLDTAFAMAFAALSDAYVHSSAFGFSPPRVALPLAEAAADRAIALDPSLSAAFASKGFILMQRRSFADADKAMRRAIELQPGYAAAHHYYSLWLASEGRTSEAQREVDKSIVLDPLSGLPNVHRGVLALLSGDRAGARRKLETAAVLNPDLLSYYWLGIAQVADGQFADGAASLERARNARTRFPESDLRWRTRTPASAGRRTPMRSWRRLARIATIASSGRWATP